MWATPSKTSPHQSPNALRKKTQEEADTKIETYEQKNDSSKPINQVDERRIALEAKMKARFEKENKRLEENNLLNADLTEEKQLELMSQFEELRGRKTQLEITAPANTVSQLDNNMPYSKHQQQHFKVEDIDSKLKEIGEAKKRRSDERKLRELKNEEQERKKNEDVEKKRLQGINKFVFYAISNNIRLFCEVKSVFILPFVLSFYHFTVISILVKINLE